MNLLGDVSQLQNAYMSRSLAPIRESRRQTPRARLLGGFLREEVRDGLHLVFTPCRQMAGALYGWPMAWTGVDRVAWSRRCAGAQACVTVAESQFVSGKN